MSTTDTAAQAARGLFSDVTPGWQRWDTQLVEATRPATEALLNAIGIRAGMQVLDLATGTGEPALSTVALVGPQGHVTATDVNPGMVAFAEAKARQHGLPNISFQVADAAALPFSDAYFDAITSRMGVMFFPRDRALAEIRRVLKPGGRVGFTVWGSYENNPWITAIREPVVCRLPERPQAAAGPDPFRYAEPGSLSADLKQAQFRDVHEQILQLTWSFKGTAREFWAFQSDLGGAWSRPGWERFTAGEQAAIESEVLALLRPYEVGERLDIPVELNLAVASR